MNLVYELRRNISDAGTVFVELDELLPMEAVSEPFGDLAGPHRRPK